MELPPYLFLHHSYFVLWISSEPPCWLSPLVVVSLSRILPTWRSPSACLYLFVVKGVVLFLNPQVHSCKSWSCGGKAAQSFMLTLLIVCLWMPHSWGKAARKCEVSVHGSLLWSFFCLDCTGEKIAVHPPRRICSACGRKSKWSGSEAVWH